MSSWVFRYSFPLPFSVLSRWGSQGTVWLVFGYTPLGRLSTRHGVCVKRRHGAR